jgi:hypothetical protein
MQKITRIILVMLIIAVPVGTAIETVNPHSFLTTPTAGLHGGILLAALFIILCLTRGARTALKPAALIVLLVAATAYFSYGIQDYCQNSYYEGHKDTVTAPELYNCRLILWKTLFKS